jgi:hypothetical protein
MPPFLHDGLPISEEKVRDLYDTVSRLADAVTEDLKAARLLWLDMDQVHVSMLGMIQVTRLTWLRMQLYNWSFHPDDLKAWCEARDPRTNIPYLEIAEDLSLVARANYPRDAVHPAIHALVISIVTQAEEMLAPYLLSAHAALATRANPSPTPITARRDQARTRTVREMTDD